MGKYNCNNNNRTDSSFNLSEHYHNRRRLKQILCNSLKISLFVIIFGNFMNAPLVKGRPLGSPSSIQEDENLSSAMMYLMKYGYMDMHTNSGKSAQLLSKDGLKKYIVEFQRFAGINQTGNLDDETMTWMHMPRCGVKDIIGNSQKEIESKRKKRFVLQGSRWRVKTISYRISKYPTTKRLDPEDVDSEIKKALDVWAEFTDLKFEPKSTGQVHIDIRFEVGEHGDGDPFDGSGGTLAHAFFPVYGGDAHFDDSESWTMNSYTGTNLLQTAAHEFGHSLGLSHSDTNAALMAPFYRGFEIKPRLHDDDKKAIQALYGTKNDDNKDQTVSNHVKSPPKKVEQETNDTSNNRDPTSSNSNSDILCKDGKIDAAVSLKDGDTYIFKGSQYWKLNEESVAPGYPKLISRDWDGLPGNIDAAFTWTNGKTYFFRGTEYWRFTDKKMDPDYPKPIRSGFDGIPSFVDAAFVWSGNGKIYFFKGDKYYRFDPEKRPPVSDGYPKPISNWEGIPNNIDDALQYSNGFTYFFKDGKYWRFNDKKFQVDDGEPGYPRPVAFWWFGCKNQSKGRTPKTNTSFNGGGNNVGAGGGVWDRADVEPKITYYNPVTTDRNYGLGDKPVNPFGWRNLSWKKIVKSIKNLFS